MKQKYIDQLKEIYRIHTASDILTILSIAAREHSINASNNETDLAASLVLENAAFKCIELGQ